MKLPIPGEEALFQSAAALSGPERAAFLDRECAGDPALRTRLNALLAAHDATDGVLASHAEANRPTIALELHDLPDPAVGMTIGRYKLLERLGAGGCGVVYVAEQTEPVRRRVALKVIKLGMDTREVIARFEAERQALALMDHPNIAKVLDAGTIGERSDIRDQRPADSLTSDLRPLTSGSGRPYFVMELVRGIRITDYCDRHNLTIQERLDLFIKVCQAIQHAHQKGIIHRDIKPSNILVTLHDGVPVPKVIDFGIAKATEGRLTNATVYTQLHQFIGTPAYMSPEQAEMSGLDIDTRSDIYSLGVLLYELLTSTTPFDAKELIASGIDAMRKTIREQEPLRPSTRLRQSNLATAPIAGSRITRHFSLSSDLDWIVMKCLEKDRTRRYETANGLAADLKRHLHNEPVVARPPSAVYRFQKAFRRNKVVYASAAVVFLALIAGFAISVSQTMRARLAERAEGRQAEQALKAQRDAEAALRRETAALTEVSRAKEALEDALRTAQRTTYVRGVALAHQEWLAGNVGSAHKLLHECGPEELRDFEWHYLLGLCQGRGSQIFEGALDAQSMGGSAYGPEAIPLATIHRDAGTSVVDAVTGEEIHWLGTNRPRWDAFALSPTGDYFATAEESEEGRDGGIAIWDRRARRDLRAIPIPPLHRISSIAFSPDGRTLAAGMSNWEKSPPDGRLMWWDVNTGDLRQSISVPSNSVQKIAFTRDGQRIIGSHGGRILTVWYTTSGAQSRAFEFGDEAFKDFTLSPDGRRIALPAGRESDVRVVDLETASETRTFFGHTDSIESLAYSPDGRWLAAGSYMGDVRVWETSTSRQVRLYRHAGYIGAVGFSSDSRQLLVNSGVSGVAGYTVWDMDIAQEVKELHHHNRRIWTVAFSPDGQFLATTADDGFALLDLAKNQTRTMLTGHQSGVLGTAFSPVDHRVATAGRDRTVRLWDRRTGELLHSLADHQSHVSTVAYSPDGNLLASASGDGTVKVRNGHSGEVLLEFTGHKEMPFPINAQATTVIFSPDGGEIASAGYDARVSLWNPISGQERLALVHKGRVRCVAYRSDGQVIATCTQAGEVKLWSAKSGEEMLDFRSHPGIPNSVAFAPNGQRIAVTSASSVRIFDTVSGLGVLTFPGGWYNGVAFSPDGRYLAAGGPGSTVRLWDGSPLPPHESFR